MARTTSTTYGLRYIHPEYGLQMGFVIATSETDALTKFQTTHPACMVLAQAWRTTIY